jgi:hypothetical protein
VVSILGLLTYEQASIFLGGGGNLAARQILLRIITVVTMKSTIIPEDGGSKLLSS